MYKFSELASLKSQSITELKTQVFQWQKTKQLKQNNFVTWNKISS